MARYRFIIIALEPGPYGEWVRMIARFPKRAMAVQFIAVLEMTSPFLEYRIVKTIAFR